MKNKIKTIKKKLFLDPVEMVEKWKDAVDKETQGMTEKEFNWFFEKEVNAVKRQYQIKTTT